MPKKTFTVQPGHTIAVNDPETGKVRWLKAGEPWEFEDDADTAEYVAAGVLQPPADSGEPPAA